MEILTVLITGTLNIACFFIGAKVGQKVVKGESIELPKLNPMQAFHDMEEKREAKREQAKVDAILRNIERYNGSSIGQEDVPR